MCVLSIFYRLLCAHSQTDDDDAQKVAADLFLTEFDFPPPFRV
jgi:hypothetical protein